MNILNLTNKGYSARFFAGITIVSLLLSAFPAAFFVANAASLYSSASASADMSTEFASGNIDASGYENLVLAFDFDASELDATPTVDSFTYGWRDAGGDNDIATFNGLAGADPAEVSSISTPLPSGAQVADLEVYVKVVANTASDVVDLTNISVSGDVVPTGPVENTDTSETFTTIQAAIDDADTENGDNIVVAAGTYNENVVVNKEVSITGAGKASTEVAAASGVAFKISANNVTISDLSATAATYAFEVKPGTIENLSLDGIKAHNSSVGLKVDSNTSIDGLTVTDSNFDDNAQGWTISAASSGATNVENVSVLDSTFNNNVAKGIYAEKMDNAEFDGITIDGSGNGDSNGSGFNINLKFSDYSNIILRNSTINNSGVGVANGTGVHITARDDGGTYGANPATLTNVSLEGNEITNNEVGVRFGEPGKNNAGPGDVEVNNNNIVGNTVIGLDNQTAQTDLDAESNWWGDVSGPSGEGAGSGDIVGEFVSFSPWLCALAPSTETTTSGFCGPKTETTVEVTGNTLTYYDEPGTWWFNRDTSTQSEFEFNNDQQTIGDGALYVEPIDGNINGDDDKFIGELFVHELVKDVETISYNYRLGDSVPTGKANEFYANVYINTDGSDNYGHCVYNVVPTDGSAGWHTMVFDPEMSYAVNTRSSYPGPGSCPASPSDLPDTAEIRVFAINLGDTSSNDLNVDGYFDEVVLETSSAITTFDFEMFEADTTVPTMSNIKMYVERNGTYEESYVVRNGDNVRVEVDVTDAGSGVDDVEFRIQSQSGAYVAARTFVDTPVSGDTYRFEYQVPVDGKYINTHGPMNQDIDGHKFWARATDNEGNYHNGLRGDFTYDKVLPEMSNIKMYVLDAGVYVESDVVGPGDSVRIEVEATDNTESIKNVEFRIQAQDGQYVALRDYVATPVSGNIYRFEYQVPVDGKYVNTHNPMNENINGHKFWARATDEAGNYHHGLKGDFTFQSVLTTDNESPIVTFKDSSITCEGGIGYEKIDFKLKDLESGIDKVVLNGKEKDLTNNSYSDFNNVTPGNWTGAVEGINVLQVYDVAGNVTELTFILCVGSDDESSAPTATVKTGDEFVKTCDEGHRMLSYKLRDEGGKIDRVVINGVEKDLTDNEWSDVNFLAPGVFGAKAGDNTMVVYDTAGNNTTYTFFLCDALVTCEITSGPNTLVVENNEFAVATYVHRNWTANIANATWVWPTEYVQTPDEEETFTFEETFTVTDIDNATIEVAADNGYKVIVNGAEVIDRTSVGNNFGDHTVLPPIDISTELISGENTVQVVVTNNATANSNARSNPAGALFKIVVNAENACTVTTAPAPEQATLVITNPATPGMTLSGIYDFTAQYNDDDETADEIAWAIRSEGECNVNANTVYGNANNSGRNDSFTFNATTGMFSSTVDMSGWTDGEYCFVVNPDEEDGEDDLRATQLFVLENSTSTSGGSETPDEGEGTDEEDEIPSAQRSGGSTSGTLTNRFSFASAPVGQVLGASTVDACPFIMEYMQIGDNNNAMQVTYLQLFLNTFKDLFGGTANPVTGVFGSITDANVKAFQEHYRSEVLDPWYERGIVPHNRPTGFVYKTTLWKINDIVCPGAVPYPSFDGESLSSNVDNDINEPVQD